ERRSRRSALDHDALQKVADSRIVLALPAAAHANEDTDRDGGRGGILEDEQGQAAVEPAAEAFVTAEGGWNEHPPRDCSHRRCPRRSRHRPPRAHLADPFGIRASLM